MPFLVAYTMMICELISKKLELKIPAAYYLFEGNIIIMHFPFEIEV